MMLMVRGLDGLQIEVQGSRHQGLVFIIKIWGRGCSTIFLQAKLPMRGMLCQGRYCGVCASWTAVAYGV